MDKDRFVIVPKEEMNVVMTIRLSKAISEEYTKLAAKTHYSRNELIGMALRYALDHMELKQE